MLPQSFKKAVHENLEKITYSRSSIFGLGLQHFNQSGSKSDADYFQMICEIQAQIKNNPADLQRLLGEAFKFFSSVRFMISHLASNINSSHDHGKSKITVAPETDLDEILNQIFMKEESKEKGDNVPAPKAVDRDSHIAKVGAIYERLNSRLSEVFAAAAPVGTPENVNAAIAKIFSLVRDLRDLACTNM